MYLNVNPIIDMLSSEECALCSPQPTASLTCLPEPGQCIHIQILDAGAGTRANGLVARPGLAEKIDISYFYPQLYIYSDILK